MNAPKPDPRMAEAAVKSADTGEKYLDWMKNQAAVTNAWAAEDRARYKDVFQPIEDKFVADSVSYDTPDRRAAAAAAAGADTQQAITLQRKASERNLSSMGVNPASGRNTATAQKDAIQSGLAVSGSGEMARRHVEAEGYRRTAAATDLGRGLAVNPGTSMGLSTGAAGSGFSGAMQGYGQMGSILGQEYDQRMQTYNANMAGLSALAGGVGKVAGFFLSSKKAKENKKPITDTKALDALRKMPVEQWDYKPGMGDGGRHVGTYSEDFTKQTGLGDGKSLGVIDAIGVTMAGVKALDRKVGDLARSVGAKQKEAA
jgi:hypothetical protein